MKEQRVISEWLYELSDDRQKVIFERIVLDNKYYYDESIFKNSENIQQFRYFIEDANRIDTTLLIYEISRRNMKDEDFNIFNSVYTWFNTKLLVVYPETKVANSFKRFSVNNKRLIELLKYFDTGITDYNMKELNENAFRQYFTDDDSIDKILPQKFHHGVLKYGNTLFEINRKNKDLKVKKLMFKHGKDETSYEYGEESDGTQRLIELLDVILNDSDDKVFVIDELDRSFHPQMTIKFVETFLKWARAKEKNTQLIITTHESDLMDLSLLRRDEIWFAEKENDNSTKLYTLEKFKIRYDKVVNKDYLAGRYGAVPVFKDFDYLWGEEETNGEIEP